MSIVLLLLGSPLLGSVVLALSGHRENALNLNAGFSFATFVVACGLTVEIIAKGPLFAWESAFFVDALNVFLVTLTAFVAFTTALFSRPYMRHERDTGKMTPLTKMHTLGSAFMPPGFHAGGLRYHGMAPLVSHLKELGLIEAVAPHQTSCFQAGVFFAQHEGIVPAPEANHAVKGAIDEAIRCKEEGISRAILFNLCGHGHFDMQAYVDYFAGKLTDQIYDEGELAMALAGLPSVPAAV